MKSLKHSIIVLMLTAFLIPACSTSSFTMGWSSSIQDQEMTASYATFSGTEYGPVFNADAGQTLTLEYDVVANKGSLTLSVQTLGGQSIWDQIISAEEGGAEGKIEIVLPDSGQYKISVAGKRTGGSYAISWLLGEG